MEGALPLLSFPAVDAIQQLALVINREKAGAPEVGEQLRQIAERAGASVRRTDEFPLPEGFLAGCDAVCVVGGDGTLLGTVPEALRHGTKVLGVNLGKLGFLVTFSPQGISESLPAILAGRYDTEDRMVLEVTTASGATRLCLNDVVVKENAPSRLPSFEVLADEDEVNTFTCDGLIVATPTGSTAYNLSAGGPIVHPRVEGIALTPICPHTLSNRSMLLPPDTALTLRTSVPSIQVALDGRLLPDAPAFPMGIRVPRQRLPLLHGQGYSPYRTVRKKLGW